MAPFRGYILTLASCVIVEIGIFYGLAGLGANGNLAVAAEMIWLCITVVLTVLVGGRFDPEGGDDRGD